ncbi:molybdenum ABC transporter ATP-binding protein [Teredinibacter turnerae]|uniref:molybdenum ABC transporter ATP-binding protein n=1 Tax=Teredinibacter turnerae TaxID=2426 RepID=UPI0030D30E49
MTGIGIKLDLQRKDFHLRINTTLPAKGVTVIYGHSGSGKTTLLRALAGLENIPGADIQFQDSLWQKAQQFVPVHNRPLGYVFQESSLFEHLSARKNLLFAQKRADKSRCKIDWEQIVELLGIGDLLDRFPAQLSGGERQRVAIARALLVQPKLLLMDEPLASLDQARKREILPYLDKLKRELDLPMVYVTHSPEEVAHLADYLVVLDKGEIVASGNLAETLTRLDFPIHLGEEAGAVLEAKVVERDAQWGLSKIEISGGHLWFRDNGIAVGEYVRIRIFARDVSLAVTPHDDTSIINSIPATVLELEADNHKGLMLVRLQLNDDIIVARVSTLSCHKLNVEPGKRFWAQIKSVAIVQ